MRRGAPARLYPLCDLMQSICACEPCAAKKQEIPYMSPDNVFFKGLELWVRENVTRKITLQEVASRYGYSKWYLNRSYMLYSGISLGAFIRLERMKAAADDLINSGNRIMDIALRYEFESQQAFTRAFSRHYGMPPATFRKVMRNRQSPDRKHS